MTIREDIAVLHALKTEHQNQTPLTAINDAISALMTIDDMAHYGLTPYLKEPASADIDIKTLYEQTTMYCDITTVSEDENYKIEIYQQPDTPIKVFVYWSKELRKITSINFTIKGE